MGCVLWGMGCNMEYGLWGVLWGVYYGVRTGQQIGNVE